MALFPFLLSAMIGWVMGTIPVSMFVFLWACGSASMAGIDKKERVVQAERGCFLVMLFCLRNTHIKASKMHTKYKLIHITWYILLLPQVDRLEQFARPFLLFFFPLGERTYFSDFGANRVPSWPSRFTDWMISSAVCGGQGRKAD